jgi:adenosine deaminase
LLATIHSDDPAYFGGYMNENFIGVAEALKMNKRQIADLAINGFKASWLSQDEKAKWVNEIERLFKEDEYSLL